MVDLGAFGVVKTGGWVARAIRVITRSTVNHAFVRVGDDGSIVEAEPKGAAHGADGYPAAIWSTGPLDDEQRTKVAREALRLVGTPYNFVDVAALGVAKILHQRTPRWVARRLSRPDRLQCAQLVDEAYLRAGIHLFDDGRLPGEVTPGDLLDLIDQSKSEEKRVE